VAAPPRTVGAGGAAVFLDGGQHVPQPRATDQRGGVGKRAMSSCTVVRSIMTRRRNSPALWSHAEPIAAISFATDFNWRLARGRVNFRGGLAMARFFLALKALRMGVWDFVKCQKVPVHE
jgi:hypothetical protein